MQVARRWETGMGRVNRGRKVGEDEMIKDQRLRKHVTHKSSSSVRAKGGAYLRICAFL